MTEARLALCPSCVEDGARHPGPLARCAHGYLRPTARPNAPAQLDADLDDATRQEAGRRVPAVFELPPWVLAQVDDQLPRGMRSALVASLLFEVSRMAAALGGPGTEEADRFLWLVLYGRFRFAMLPPGGPLKHWEELVKAFTRATYDELHHWQPYEEEPSE